MANIYYCMHWFQIHNFTHYKNTTKSKKQKSRTDFSQLQTLRGFSKIYDTWVSLPTSSCCWDDRSLGHDVGLLPETHNPCSIASLSFPREKGIVVATCRLQDKCFPDLLPLPAPTPSEWQLATALSFQLITSASGLTQPFCPEIGVPGLVLVVRSEWFMPSSSLLPSSSSFLMAVFSMLLLQTPGPVAKDLHQRTKREETFCVNYSMCIHKHTSKT